MQTKQYWASRNLKNGFESKKAPRYLTITVIMASLLQMNTEPTAKIKAKHRVSLVLEPSIKTQELNVPSIL